MTSDNHSKLNISRHCRGVMLVAVFCMSLIFTTSMNSSEASGNNILGIFKMHRAGLRVRLEVHGNKILPTRVWALVKCDFGFEAGTALRLEAPDQAIKIRRDGRFSLRRETSRSRTRLVGRVKQGVIVGFYSDWYLEGSGANEKGLCGTGRPGKRSEHFVAKRAVG